jgi:hypothetical protein
MAVLRDVAPLRLGNLQKIAADASETDGLRRGRAFIGHRHLLEIVVIDAKQKGTRNENRDQSTHSRSLAPGRSACKSGAKEACARKQQNSFAASATALLPDFSHRRRAKRPARYRRGAALGIALVCAGQRFPINFNRSQRRAAVFWITLNAADSSIGLDLDDVSGKGLPAVFLERRGKTGGTAE